MWIFHQQHSLGMWIPAIPHDITNGRWKDLCYPTVANWCKLYLDTMHLSAMPKWKTMSVYNEYVNVFHGDISNHTQYNPALIKDKMFPQISYFYSVSLSTWIPGKLFFISITELSVLHARGSMHQDPKVILIIDVLHYVIMIIMQDCSLALNRYWKRYSLSKYVFVGIVFLGVCLKCFISCEVPCLKKYMAISWRAHEYVIWCRQKYTCNSSHYLHQHQMKSEPVHNAQA